MTEFIGLTHTHSGDVVNVKIRSIVAIRNCGVKTLILIENSQGMYVNEYAEDLRVKVEMALKELNKKGWWRTLWNY